MDRPPASATWSQVTKVSIEGDKILLEINGGMKGKGGHWYDHVQVGMGHQHRAYLRNRRQQCAGRNQHRAAVQ